MVCPARKIAARKERTAQLECKQTDPAQSDVFVPVYEAKHRWKDRWKTVSLPLFAGYLFCRSDAAQRLRVLAMLGVIDFVRIGSEPAPVLESEIEASRVC